MAGRGSQIVVEVDANGTPTGRVSQVIEEISAFGTPTGRVSQVTVDFGAFGTPHARVSQLTVESAALATPHARVSQLVVEFLVLNHRVLMPSIYPTLPGLDIAVLWRPKGVNFSPQTHTSGREVRIAAAQYPLHEFELQYNVLRDRPTEIELKTLLGFFLGIGGGTLNGFLFSNPYDQAVTGQSFVTTDGVNSEFGPLVRTYGADGYLTTEPVGYVDLTNTFNLYRDGVLIDPSDATWGYTVLTTQPVNQQVKFNNTPAGGHVLTVDMTYWYYVRFSDDSLDFEQILWRIFQAKKVKLVSLRG